MLLNHWLRLLRRNFRRTPSRSVRRLPQFPRTARSAEVLEDRTLLSTFYVDAPADFAITNDQGAGGLDAGDEVTWRSGEPEEQAGLIFGTDAFGTIQDALTATTGSIDPTDTVVVGDGAYNEDLVVAKAGVTLRSANGAAVTAIDLVDGVGIEIQGSANNFTLGGAPSQGFTINSGTATTFLIELTDVPADVTISHNTLDLTDGGMHTAAATAASRGISIADGATRLTIDSNNFIAGEDDSAVFGDNPLVDLAVTNNDLMVDVGGGIGVGQQTSGAGISLYGVTASNPANPSLIEGNTITGYATGILIASGTGTADLRISENAMSAGSDGIRFIDGILSGTPGFFGTVEVWRNTVTGYIHGVWVDSGANVATGTFDIRNNRLTMNDVGLTFSSAAGNATVVDNDLSGNMTFSVDNNDTAALNASGNWWGAATPESDVTAEMDGLVDYSPWLGSGMDSDLSTAGFQGDFSTLHVSTGGEHTGMVDRLQEAVDLVATNGTVLIHSGTYQESVTINKSLTFDGSTSTATDVNIEPGTGMDGITVTADNVTIRDLRVRNWTRHGISATNVAGLTLSNVHSVDNGEDGVHGVDLGGLATISGGQYTGNGDDGLDLDGDNLANTRLVVDTNVNASTNNDDGLAAQEFPGDGAMTGVSITGGTFNDNDADNSPGTAGGDGIDLTNVGAVTLVNATATGNDPGITVSGAASFSDADGNYSNNDDHGIRLADIAGNVTLVRTVADDNDADDDGTGDGLHAVDGADADAFAIGGNLLVQGARFRDSGIMDRQQHGVFIESLAATSTVVFEDSTGTVQSVLVTGNEDSGVVIADGGTTARFTNGTYSANNGDGLRLVSFSGTITLNGITSNDNPTDGLFIDGAGGLDIDNVTANSNGNDGFDARNVSGTADVDGGSFSMNGLESAGNGFSLQGSFSPLTIDGGVYQNNVGGSGLVLVGNGSNVGTLTNVTATGNGIDGLNASFMDSLTVSGDTYNGNVDDGIDASAIGMLLVNNNATVNGNGNHGVEADGITSAGFGLVTASNNTADGLHLSTIAGLVISNVTATMNGNDGLDGANVSGTALFVWDGNFSMNGQAGSGNGFALQGSFDELQILGGLYQENVNGSGIVLINDGSGNAGLDDVIATGNGIDGVNANTLNFLRFHGGTLDSNADDGVDATAMAELTAAGTVTSFTANANGDHGIEADGVGSVGLYSITASNNSADGLHLDSITNLTVRNITANTNGNDGLEATNVSGVVDVDDGSFSMNGQGGFGNGFSLQGAFSLLTIDNGSYLNNVGGSGLVLVGNGSNVGTLTGVTASSNGIDGLNATSMASLTVSGGTYSANLDDGIDASAIGTLTVSNNATATVNGDHGIEADGITNATFATITASNNTADGLHLDMVANLTVTNVTANLNGDDGLDATNVSGTVDVDGGSFSTNGQDGAGHGFSLQGSFSPLTIDSGFYQNNVSGNGVVLTGNGNNAGTLTGLTATGNDLDGLNASSMAALTVSGGTYNTNVDDGIDAGGIGTLTVNSNAAANLNGDNGIEADQIGTLVASNTTANQNQNDGLQAQNVSGAVSITASTFNDNDADNAPGTAGGDGIDLMNVGAVTLVSVTAIGNDPGIAVSGAASFSDTDGNYSNNDAHGILLIDIVGNVTLIRTVADNNDADNDGIGDGLRVVDGGDADTVAIGGNLLVQGARFRDTGGAATHQEHGVFIQSLAATSTVIFENSTGVVHSVEVTGNENSGVVIADGGTMARFTNGTYSNNAGDGLRLLSFSAAITLNGITANNNTVDGVFIDGAGGLDIDNATANSNRDDGFDATNVSGTVDVDGGSFSTNGRDGSGNGFSLQGSFSELNIAGGTYNANLGGSGIRLVGNGANTATLIGVTTNSNEGDGLQGSSLAALSAGGTFNGNGSYGIKGVAIGTMDVSATATRNGLNGIDAAQVGALAVQSTTADENFNDGLRAVNTGAVTITGSSFDDNDFDNSGSGDGVDLLDVGEVVISDSQALGNNRGLSVATATSVSDTNGQYSGNNDSGILLFDILGGVTLTGTASNNNDADFDSSGNGVWAILIGGTLTINGGSFSDTNGAAAGLQQQFGLHLSNVINVNIHNGVQVTGSRQTGARLHDVGSGSGGMIDGSNFFGNAGYGLHFTNVNHTAVTNNTIARNGNHGLLIETGPLSGPYLPNEQTSVGNRISRNVMYANAGLGVNLRDAADLGNGVTLNDKGTPQTADSDDGVNRLQNTPEIMYAFVQRDASGLATSLTIVYHVPTPLSAANYGDGLRVEFFLSDFLPDGSALSVADVDGREGAAFVASDIYQAAEALTPKTKSFARSQLSAGILSVLDRSDVRAFETPVRIVAAATDADGNTSEFSRAGVINPQPGIEPIVPQAGKLYPTELPARHYLDPLAATGFFFRPGPVNPDPMELLDYQFQWDTRGDNLPPTVLPTFFNNEFGIYTVDTADGQVNGVAPSFNSTYAQQALDPANIQILRQKMGTRHNPGTSSGYFDVAIDVHDRVGFYLVRNSTSANLLSNVPLDGSMQPNPTNARPGSLFEDLALAFFSFANANPDSSSAEGPKHHIRTELVKVDDDVNLANPDDGDFTGQLIIYWEDSYAPNNSGFGSSDFDQGFRDGEDAIITLYDPFVAPLLTSDEPAPAEVTPNIAASAAPTLTAPSASSPIGTTVDTTPTFSWTPVAGAARYDVWVNDLTTGQSGVIRNQYVMGASFTPTEPLADGHSYIWTVRGVDASGNVGAWASHAVFSIQTPAELTLIGPKAAAPTVVPTFEWSAVAGAVRYDVWVNDLTTGQSGIIRDQNVSGTMFTPSGPLADGHRYIWTVRGIDASGTAGEWANHATFTALAAMQQVMSTPGTPTAIGPTGAADGILPTFQWTATVGAGRYDLWVNDLTTGESGVIREKHVSGTSFTPTTPLVAGHRYIWTVRAISSGGMAGEWAVHQTFTATFGVPVLLAPASAGASTAPTFQWTAVAGAVRYDLWVNNLTTGQFAVIRNQNVVGTSYAASGLTAGHRYIWTVRAIASDGSASSWATHRTFTVAANAASGLLAEEPDSFEVLDSDESREQEIIQADVESTEGSTEPSHRAALHQVMATWNETEWWSGTAMENTSAG